MQVRIRGIGPHEDTRFALDEKGVTTIRGASASGKSTVMHATACALWGTDAEGAANGKGPWADLALDDHPFVDAG